MDASNEQDLMSDFVLTKPNTYRQVICSIEQGLTFQVVLLCWVITNLKLQVSEADHIHGRSLALVLPMHTRS